MSDTPVAGTDSVKREPRTLSKAVERSVALFNGGLYCSEAILKAFNEEFGLGLAPDAYRIATAFGAGIGASKCACGAVTGGVLVLSLALGRTGADRPETPAFEAAARLHNRWVAEEGAVCCRVLTRHVVWGSPEHHAACGDKVRAAARLTDEILSTALNGGDPVA